MNDNDLWKDIEGTDAIETKDLAEAISMYLKNEQYIDGMTTREISETVGISFSVADRIIKKMFDAGEIETGRGKRKNRAGIFAIVPVYRLKKQNQADQGRL